MSSMYNIVIAERGWMYVGITARDGDRIVITNCYNIRNWGTTEGLGQLALHGPQPATKLDFYGTVRVHVLAIAGGEIECDDAVWKAWADQQTKAKRR